MKGFYDKDDYTIEDINDLIINQAEESIYLDFKEAGALDKSERKRIDISKDVASFANSDGGIIVYGLKEVDHKASELSFVNGNEFTKEWLEQVINSGIQRRIEGVNIYPIRIDGDIKKSIYVIKIPVSFSAPHLSKDNRYYKRYNFMSVPMEEYEVRQTYGRAGKTELTTSALYTNVEIDKDDDEVKLTLDFSVMNLSNSVENTYKLNVYIITGDIDEKIGLHWDVTQTNIGYTRLDSKFKISANGISPLFPKESLSISRFTLTFPTATAYSSLRKLKIETLLFYSSGESKGEEDNFQIAERIKNKLVSDGYAID
jgi:predicted HTH transcriptional regulator